MWAIAALKTVVALAAPIIVFRPQFLPPWTSGRTARILSWIAAVTLVAYGGLLTLVGLLIQAGVVDAEVGADDRALTWHAFLWDPWFFIWGLAFAMSLWLTRRGGGDG